MQTLTILTNAGPARPEFDRPDAIEIDLAAEARAWCKRSGLAYEGLVRDGVMIDAAVAVYPSQCADLEFQGVKSVSLRALAQIHDLVAATRAFYGEPPALGMVTFAQAPARRR